VTAKDSLLSPLSCECLLLSAQLRATQRVKTMQLDQLLPQPPLFCHRASLPVKPRAPQQAKKMRRFRLAMPSFEFSYACDVLPGTVLLRATLPE